MERHLFRCFLVLSGLLIYAKPGFSNQCVSLVKGPVTLKVSSCGYLKPESSFDPSLEKYKFIAGLPRKEQMAFWNSYRGMIIKGVVVRSLAVRTGLGTRKGVLKGERVSVFVHPGTSRVQCQHLRSGAVEGVIEEACCVGGGDAPCLLASSYVLKNLKVGGALPQAGKKVKRRPNSKHVNEANKFYFRRNYQKAIELYEKARNESALTALSYYRLALSLRNEDKCTKALKYLKDLESVANRESYNDTLEKTLVRGQYLSARCYAKLNKPNDATFILNRFLLNPQKYRSEIVSSLSHKDFGWIKTTKVYLEYRKNAREALHSGKSR